ncbi:MAG: tetratricopeptide repeat protein [Gemmatimonadales bacterium]
MPLWSLPLAALLLAGGLSGCALKSDVRRVETEVAAMRLETARQDSIHAARLAEVIVWQQNLMDSLRTSVAEMERAVSGVQGAVAGDLYRIQQQLVQVQELTGQSQQRLSELRTQLEARNQQLSTAAADTGPPPPAAAGAPSGAAPAASADQMYEASLQQFRRGSVVTARMGFRELLRQHPASTRVPDAVYFIGESYAADAPDSAAAYYERVVSSYPTSARAASALYKLGLLAERRGDRAAARTYFQRVAREYPRSDEAALVPDKLKALGQ